MNIESILRLKYIPALIFILLFSVKSLFAIEPVVLNDQIDEYIIGKNIEYLKDPDKKFKISEVISDEFRGRFVVSDENYPNFGYTSAAYWLRFKIKNSDEHKKRWILLNNYPLTDDMKIFMPELHGQKPVKHGGRFLPYYEKDEDYRAFAFHLDVEPNSEYTYYVRVESEDSLVAILSILSPKKFADKKHTTQLFLGLYYGFIFAMIVYYIFVFFSTRDMTQLYYVLTLIFLHFLFQFSLNGFSPEYIDQDSLWWSRTSIVVFEAMGVFFAMQFAKVFLNTKQNAPFFHKLYNIVMYIVLIIAALSFFVKYHYMIIAAVLITMSGAMLMWSAGLYCYRKGFRAARFYLLAWTAIQFFGCFYGLKTLGLIDSTFISEWGFQIGSLIHSFLMSFALVDLINIMRTDKDRVLKESMQLKEEMNINLEHKVQERTEELRTAMSQMELMNQEIIQARDAIWGEMQLAKKIQTVLLPVKPQIKGYDISVFLKPADEVGGDYYDIINVENIDWIIIGDVSGHGVPAGLIMMMVQTSIHTVLVNKGNMKPETLLTRINTVITRNIRLLSEDKYMTLTVFACIKDGKFFHSGLHQDIMVYRAAEKKVELIGTNGMWIGIMDDIKGMVKDDNFHMGVGDAMMLFTDGITEAWVDGSVRDVRNPETDMFGQEKLLQIFEDRGESTPDDIKNGILQELDGYMISDDVTIVIIKRME
jgi:serine phosphatase RsbU (regulator of sigma subunit)